MTQALALARKALGHVASDPLVGAVIVKNNEIIGQGYHHHFGSMHAELDALQNCIRSPKGATLYVTLEPCCHYGKNPPCTSALIESGIKKVVVGTLDKNPLVSGHGVEQLRSHGIEVEVGVLEEKCQRLIRFFTKYITTKTPFVILKYAMTLDGKIATYTGDSRWISGKAARTEVHNLRAAVSAIMVGVNTVIKDDPLLTCRSKENVDPIRIICDTTLKTPLTAKIIQTATEIPTYIATTVTDEQKRNDYVAKGCHIVNVSKKEGHLDLRELMQILGEKGIDSILLEGGSILNWGALDAQIIDEIHTYISPKLLGGLGKTPISGKGVATLSEAIAVHPFEQNWVGADLVIKSEVEYKCLPE